MPSTLTHADAVALFERRRDAWLAEDLDAYLDLFADDLVVQTPAGPPLQGRGAYEELVRVAARATRPLSFEFHRIAVHERHVLAEWSIELEVRSSGRRIRYRGMSSCELCADGRISMWREYYDPADLRPVADDGRRTGSSAST